MSTTSEPCPFKPGDRVVYRPSQKGWDVTPPWERTLERGGTYVVREILQDRYVVVDVPHNPGGGLYWTEFEAAP